MEVIELVVRDTEEITNRKVLAVYLRGSRIRGLNDDESDYDITVLTNPTKRELLTNVMFSKKLILPQYNVEGNITTTAHFYKLLLKGSPVALETIHACPLYIDKSFQILAALLYENRKEILQSRTKSYLLSNIRMCKMHLNRLVKQGDPTKIGKNLVYAKMVLLQCVCVANGGNLDFGVPFNNELRDYLCEMKQNRTLMDCEMCLEELNEKEVRYDNGSYQDDKLSFIFDKLESQICDMLMRGSVN